MKVSVAFGDKRVVVPCKDGSLSVRDLMEEAARRFRKTNSIKMEGGGCSSFLLVDAPDISVYGIESLDGAIYDLDDRVCDVADDKETLVALFHEVAGHGGLGGGGGGGGDCASSGDGGNSSEHFTSSLTNEFRISTLDRQSESDSHPHAYSEVLRTKSEEVLSKTSSNVPLLDEIEYSIGAKNRRVSSPPRPPKPRVLTSSPNIPEAESHRQLSDEIEPRSPSPELFNSSQQNSFKVRGQDARSHTEGDLKSLKLESPAESNNRNSQKKKLAAEPQMFRRTFGAEASPRQTARGNSEMIDRWMTTHILKDDPDSPPFICPTTIDPRPNPRPAFESSRSSGPTEKESYLSRNVAENSSDRSKRVFSSPAANFSQRTVTVVNDEQPLGIQVVAQYEKKRQPPINKNGVVSQHDLNEKNVAVGLLVRHVNPGGKADQQSILLPKDLITEINGQSLYGLTFETAQDVFKSALQKPTLTLRIVSSQTTSTRSGQPSSPTHVSSGNSTSVSITPASSNNDHQSGVPQGTNRAFFPSPDRNHQSRIQSSNGYPGAFTLPRSSAGGSRRKSEGAHLGNEDVSTPSPLEHQNRTFHFDSPLSLMGRANTKKIGRKIRVQLVKGTDGLGFSLTARDNSGPSNANSPVYIKKILTKGAAIQDGRLMEGDRILEVNGSIVTGMSQGEVVSFLRSIPEGHTADILVSRQEVEDIPREIIGTQEKMPDQSLHFNADSKCGAEDSGTVRRSTLNFIIPLNDTGSAGLGISVKGRTQKDLETGVSRDTGVFVKAVISGGAAWKDGRLKVNDQLLSVNDQLLVGMDNKPAIDVLKNALLQHGKSGLSSLRVTVSRLETSEGEMEASPSAKLSESYHSNHLANESNINAIPVANSSPRDDFNRSRNEEQGDGHTGRGFSREDIHRRSLSEKRTSGGRVRDANELAFYREKIKPLKDAVNQEKAEKNSEPSRGNASNMRSASVESVSRHGPPGQSYQNQLYQNGAAITDLSGQGQRRPSASNSSAGGGVELNEPPPVPMRRARPPSAESNHANYQNQRGSSIEDGKENFARTFGDPTRTSKEKDKKNKTGIFRGLFRSHKKTEKDPSTAVSSGSTRSYSAPLRPQSIMPLPAHRLSGTPPSSVNYPHHNVNTTLASPGDESFSSNQHRVSAHSSQMYNTPPQMRRPNQLTPHDPRYPNQIPADQSYKRYSSQQPDHQQQLHNNFRHPSSPKFEQNGISRTQLGYSPQMGQNNNSVSARIDSSSPMHNMISSFDSQRDAQNYHQHSFSQPKPTAPGVGVTLSQESPYYIGSYSTLPSHPQIKRSPKKMQPPAWRPTADLENYGTQNDVIRYQPQPKKERPLSGFDSDISMSPMKENSYGVMVSRNNHPTYAGYQEVGLDLNLRTANSAANLSNSSKHNRSYDHANGNNINNNSFSSDIDVENSRFAYYTGSPQKQKSSNGSLNEEKRNPCSAYTSSNNLVI